LDFEFFFLLFKNIGFAFQNIDDYVLSTYSAIVIPNDSKKSKYLVDI